MPEETIRPPPPPPPPPPPRVMDPSKQSFARRYKFVWPVLLTVNLALGAYLFMRTKKRTPETDRGEVVDEVTAPVVTKPVAVPEKVQTPLQAPPTVHEPIPEDQQRELFKWILEEKRKLKSKDPQEKKRIDEEKAILKQYIRAKSIPTI
ncbi:mitochondrial import inner membrane translocase subunit tim54 isoform X2 [Amborella trichopoda]|nr:mitochondrial import inner membrane translocase subunit tim54 isoform X2 [Amborella trichopoda]|eukprot:XP_011628515.1 mitochondrial import inner membrane translocase subunit tim54 isoform X2 [Amborella trichopoda]